MKIRKKIWGLVLSIMCVVQLINPFMTVEAGTGEVHYDEPGIPVTQEMMKEWNTKPGYSTTWGSVININPLNTPISEGTEGGRHYIKYQCNPPEGFPNTDTPMIIKEFDDYKVTKDGKWVYTTDWLPVMTAPHLDYHNEKYGSGDFGLCYEMFYSTGNVQRGSATIEPNMDYYDPNNIQLTENAYSWGTSLDVYISNVPAAYARYLENQNRPHDGNGIRIVAYYGDDEDIVVPSTIEGKPVTIVENLYWHNWVQYESYNIYTPTRSITFPDSVVGIWNIKSTYAEKMGDLKKIVLPKDLKYMFNSFFGKNLKGVDVVNMPSTDKMVSSFTEPYATDDDYLTQWEINYYRGEDCDATCFNESNSHPWLKENGYDVSY